MAKVKVLAPEIVARIAAGEVVDRPASVVKELMENALDAGATKVEVHLKDGGKTFIQIKDNGSGIGREDLEALFTRHATSKITSAEDLDALVSLGFRGEALYSIAAVSEVLVRSRTEKSKDAWEIFLRGGKRERLAPAAVAHRGTEVCVEEIFFNTPARKKFLKSDSAELDQVVNVFVPYALLYPSHHFILVNNGRSVYDLKPAASFAVRAADVLNLEARHIIEFDEVAANDGVTLKLVLGDINIQRPRRDLQYLFVNGRPVQHKNFSFQMNDVYRLILSDGVHPFFVVFINVPPEDVDVNIHPQKREVRIKQEGRVASVLRQAVERALMTKGGAKEVGRAGLSDEIFTFNPTPMREEGVPSDRIIFGPGQKGIASTFSSSRESVSGASSSPQFTADFMTNQVGSVKDRLLAARFIGTLAQKYHLFEEVGSLFAVDQHAAQERINFEKFLAQVEAGKVEVQRFLVPEMLKLTPQEMLVWEESAERLKEFGFETTQVDATAIAVNARPLVLARPDLVVRALLSDETIARADKDKIARRACRASVMTGDAMSATEAVHQLKALALCKDPMTCPHGRPVFIELKLSFFDRQFLRT